MWLTTGAGGQRPWPSPVLVPNHWLMRPRRPVVFVNAGEIMRAGNWSGMRAGLLLTSVAVVLSGLIAGCRSGGGSSKPGLLRRGRPARDLRQDLGNVDVAKNGLDPLKAVLRSVQSSAQTFVSGPSFNSCGPFADC